MRIWKVRVHCHFEGKKRLERCWMTALVEANTSVDAMKAGAAHVESMAPVDVKWRAFEPMEASSVVLPLLVEDL